MVISRIQRKSDNQYTLSFNSCRKKLLKNDLFPHPNPTLHVAHTNFNFILIISRHESNENVPIFSAGAEVTPQLRN
jgi:hypothetical protein